MTFRQTGLCRLIVLALALCVLSGAVPAALGEAEMTEEQWYEASKKAYDEAMREGETQIAFTTIATIGQYLSDLMTYTYGEIPASETDSANAAVQLVDEVIRRADACFLTEEAGIAAEKLAGFDQAKEAWKTAAAQFGAEGERFEAGLPLMDSRVFDMAFDAFGRIPAEAHPVYLEEAESVYRAIWRVLLPAMVEKVGDTFSIPGVSEYVDFEGVSEAEDAVVDFLAGVKGTLSSLSDGFGGEHSEERTRIEQIGSRLNTLESEVKMAINALGIDTVSRLMDD